MTATTKAGNIAAWIGTVGGMLGLLAEQRSATKYGMYISLAALMLGNLANAMGNRQSQTGSPQT